MKPQHYSGPCPRTNIGVFREVSWLKMSTSCFSLILLLPLFSLRCVCFLQSLPFNNAWAQSRTRIVTLKPQLFFYSQNYFVFYSNGMWDIYLYMLKANSPHWGSQAFTRWYKSITWQSNDVKWKGDHCRPRPQTDILDHKWKKCSSDLNHLLPLLSAISPNDIPKFVFNFFFFLIRPRFPKPLVLLHVSYNHV